MAGLFYPTGLQVTDMPILSPANQRRVHSLLMAALAVISTPSAWGNELYGLGGIDSSLHKNVGSYSWQLGYTQDLLPNIAASFCYLNEGHLSDHRRDGYSAQIWARTDLIGDRLNLGAGAGPYLFFDTKDLGAGNFVNNHGFRALLSVAATWRTEGSLIFLLRSNYVTGEDSPDTISAMAGIGVEFRDKRHDPPSSFERRNNELSVLMGQTIANSLDSQRSLASALEYRRTLIRHLELTVTLLDEGDNRLIRRDGLVPQVWVTQELHHDRFIVGAGAGAYIDLRHREPRSRVSGITGVTGAYRITPDWALRLIWDRVISDYDRDSDVLLGGVGFRF